jgi:Rap1a immunity proteins
MRIPMLIVAAVSVALAVPALGAKPINTGEDLVAVCEPYSKLDEGPATNAAKPDRCQQFLSDFLTAFIEAEKIRLDAIARGLPGGAASPCVRLPDRLTYRELAKRVVAMAWRDPDLLNGSAAMLVRRTLEHDFPCPSEARPSN